MSTSRVKRSGASPKPAQPGLVSGGWAGDGADLGSLLRRIDPRYLPVWTERFPGGSPRPPEEQWALARYFLPHRSRAAILTPTRPGLIKWYCPFADQRLFASGHRYCLNVYVGCSHGCHYCYARAYDQELPLPKRDFARLLTRDLADLEAFAVPPAPLHLSNSTDPLQQLLETTNGHTAAALTGILAHRRRFSRVTVLTRNPALAAEEPYRSLGRALATLPADHPARLGPGDRLDAGFRVEVSLAFWRDEARRWFEPMAPTVEERLAGIEKLRAAGIPVALRIDPLFPRSPLLAPPALAVTDDRSMPAGGWGGARCVPSPTMGDSVPLPPGWQRETPVSRSATGPSNRARPPLALSDFGVPEGQSIADLRALVRFAADVGVTCIVYSVARLTTSRRRCTPPSMLAMRRVYDALSPTGRAVFRGNSWRLPETYAREQVIAPLLDLCRGAGIPAVHCIENLLSTR